MSLIRALAVSAGVVLILFMSTATALAHVDLDHSTPALGSTVDAPLRTVQLVFTEPAAPVETGVELLDGSGSVHVPVRLKSIDGTMWEAEFDSPIDPGTVAVRWTMRAGDAHPRSGTFTFELAPAALDHAASSSPSAPDDSTADAGEALVTFLDAAAPGRGAARLATVGRALAMVGAVLGVGGLAFAALVLRGEPNEVRRAVFWIRRFGVITAVGAGVELLGQTVVDASGNWIAIMNPFAVAGTLATGVGLAIAIRLVGGMALTATSRLTSATASSGPDVVAMLADRVPTSVSGGVATVTKIQAPHAVRLDGSDSVWAFVAATGLVLSFALDGHTATAGHPLVTMVANTAHVVGASIWAGGVVMLALIAAYRHRRGVEPDVPVLAVRFSVVASVAVVAVGAAGLLLTWTILDGVTELWTTGWGRLVSLKLGIVALAGWLGYHNHHTVIPRYLSGEDRPAAYAALKRSVTLEAVILTAVIVVTALLVAASSS